MARVLFPRSLQSYKHRPYIQHCEWRNAGSSHLTQIEGLFLEDVMTEQAQEDSRNQAYPVENPGGGKRMVSLGLNHRNQRVLEMSLVVIRVWP